MKMRTIKKETKNVYQLMSKAVLILSLISLTLPAIAEMPPPKNPEEVLSGNRKLKRNGKLPPVGNTVDAKTANIIKADLIPFCDRINSVQIPPGMCTHQRC